MARQGQGGGRQQAAGRAAVRSSRGSQGRPPGGNQGGTAGGSRGTPAGRSQGGSTGGTQGRTGGTRPNGGVNRQGGGGRGNQRIANLRQRLRDTRTSQRELGDRFTSLEGDYQGLRGDYDALSQSVSNNSVDYESLFSGLSESFTEALSGLGATLGEAFANNKQETQSQSSTATAGNSINASELEAQNARQGLQSGSTVGGMPGSGLGNLQSGQSGFSSSNAQMTSGYADNMKTFGYDDASKSLGESDVEMLESQKKAASSTGSTGNASDYYSQRFG